MSKSVCILFLLCALSVKVDAQSLSQNYILGKQMLDAEGTRAITSIQRGNISTSVIQTNTYNRYNDQLETVRLQAGGSEKVIASYTYNDVGKLVNVGRSGSAGNICKEYNVRGWL